MPQPENLFRDATPDTTQKPERRWIHLVLFAATLVTTTWTGFILGGTWYLALSFSLALMSILLIHEMGHFLASKKHGIPSTLPYFIPAPPYPIGTFGAIIRMKGAIWDRRALLDIGVSGPVAGFAVALPVLVAGVFLSEVVPIDDTVMGLHMGNSLLMYLIEKMVIGNVPPGMELVIHPLGFAGWIGMFVTSLNLLPVSQLDGGHIAKAMFPDSFDTIARVVHISLLFMGVFFWPGWLFWAIILFFIGVRHPPVLLPHISLDGRRRKVGYFTLAIFILTFVPTPIKLI